MAKHYLDTVGRVPLVVENRKGVFYSVSQKTNWLME
jgi:hypothetical protein